MTVEDKDGRHVIVGDVSFVGDVGFFRTISRQMAELLAFEADLVCCGSEASTVLTLMRTRGFGRAGRKQSNRLSHDAAAHGAIAHQMTDLRWWMTVLNNCDPYQSVP